MKKTLWRTFLLVFVAAGSFGGLRQLNRGHQSPVPHGVGIGNGRIESIQVDIAAKYGGRIKEILAKEGDLVSEGQVVARMDTDELNAELARDKAKSAESQEAANEVQAEIARRESELK